MKQSSGKSDKHRWVWPQFSLLELLLATAVLVVLWSFLAVREETDELIGSIAGSLVIVWCLVCWKTVRANRLFAAIATSRHPLTV
jgi:hypothetical protein